MDVEVLELSDRHAKVRLEGVTHAFPNAVRRTLVADVPKMAIHDVTIYDNTSALFDEILAHRLGLLPVPTDLEIFNFRESCVCEGEGCENCTILYTLSKEGPGTVVSGDLTPTDPSLAIADDDIPIVSLREGQRVMLEASAILGTGSRDAKWSPVNGAALKELPVVEIDDEPEILPSTVTALRKVAPEGTVAFDDGKIEVLDLERAYDFLRTAKDLHDLENVHLSTRKDAFLLRFDTDGSLTAQAALLKALEILMGKLEQVEDDVADL